MDILLIITLKYLKSSMRVVKTDFKRSVSQILDTHNSFCFIVCRRHHFAKTLRK